MKPLEVAWSAWCPLCHRTIVERPTRAEVSAVFAIHADEVHAETNWGAVS